MVLVNTQRLKVNIQSVALGIQTRAVTAVCAPNNDLTHNVQVLIPLKPVSLSIVIIKDLFLYYLVCVAI